MHPMEPFVINDSSRQQYDVTKKCVFYALTCSHYSKCSARLFEVIMDIIYGTSVINGIQQASYWLNQGMNYKLLRRD